MAGFVIRVTFPDCIRVHHRHRHLRAALHKQFKKQYSPGSLGFYALKRASISDDFVSVSIRSRLVRQFLAGSLRVRPQCHFAWIPVCSPTRRGAVGVTQRLPDTKYGQYVQGTRGVAGTNKHRMCLYLIANLLAVGSEASIPL